MARRTQAERSATTRSALVAAARELFAEQGYAATGREEIAARAGVTRGALYHHFESKADLFAAVVRSLDEELAARVVRVARRAGSSRDLIRRAARAYVSACAEADVARILVDARSVLGGATAGAISSATCHGLLRSALERAASGGADVPGDVDVLAAVLLAALDEAALLVAAAPDRRRARSRVTRTVDQLLDRLLR